VSSGILQNVVVHLAGETCIARGQVDGVAVGQGSADAALAAAVQHVAAAGGGEVMLQPGRYVLQQPLELADRVVLRGSGRGTRLVVASQAEDAIGVLARSVGGVVVRDLAVEPLTPQSAFAGVVLDDCGDCQVLDVYARHFAGHGIVVRNNSFLCEVRGCKLADNSRSGLLMDHLFEKGRVGDFIPNLVTNCIAYGGGHGFQTIRTIVANFVGCQAFQTRLCGFRIEGVSNSVALTGCRTFKIVGDAVSVEASHEFNATGNIFC
jgi:hypothetical protein